MTIAFQKKLKTGIVKKQDILENQVSYVYLALGSNLGNKIQNLEFAKYELLKKDIKIIKASSYYRSKSWPDTKFPEFVNCVLFVQTKLILPELFKIIKLIEKSIGRKKTLRNYPRVCDIDIIDFNGQCLSTGFKFQKILVPHQSMHKRNFVLMPLFEINKNWFHPKLKKNIINLLFSLPRSDLKAIKFS